VTVFGYGRRDGVCAFLNEVVGESFFVYRLAYRRRNVNDHLIRKTLITGDICDTFCRVSDECVSVSVRHFGDDGFAYLFCDLVCLVCLEPYRYLLRLYRHI
jgi:hypothetical protein